MGMREMFQAGVNAIFNYQANIWNTWLENSSGEINTLEQFISNLNGFKMNCVNVALDPLTNYYYCEVHLSHKHGMWAAIRIPVEEERDGFGWEITMTRLLKTNDQASFVVRFDPKMEFTMELATKTIKEFFGTSEC